MKIPLRSNALIKIENDDNICFIWSKLASLQPCDNDQPNGVTNYKQYFDEINVQGFNFTNGFKDSDVQKIQKLNNLPINVFELFLSR